MFCWRQNRRHQLLSATITRSYNIPSCRRSIGVERITKAFHSGKTHSLQFRLKQLRNLYFTMKDNQEALCDALQKDFHRLPSETRNYEFATGLNELVFIMSQLHKWSKPQPVDELP